jgi:hypothetical protein
MNDQDVELSRREAELTQEEATLHAELTRAMAATTDVERRLKQLKTSVAEAEVAGVKDSHVLERVQRHAVPALDADGALAGARSARAQALSSRAQANAEVRSRIMAFRASLQQLQQTLGVDEKALQRVLQQARQAVPEPPREEGTAATLISGAPPPGLKARAQPPAPPAAATVPKRQSPRVRMQAQVDFESASRPTSPTGASSSPPSTSCRSARRSTWGSRCPPASGWNAKAWCVGCAR